MKGGTALVIGVICLMPMLSACGEMFSCSHVSVAEMVSPDGRFTAQVDKVDCGATTQEAFWVTLHDKQSLLQNTQRVAVFDHTERVGVTWLESRQIVVEANGGKRYGTLADWHGVRISYR